MLLTCSCFTFPPWLFPKPTTDENHKQPLHTDKCQIHCEAWWERGVVFFIWTLNQNHTLSGISLGETKQHLTRKQMSKQVWARTPWGRGESAEGKTESRTYLKQNYSHVSYLFEYDETFGCIVLLNTDTFMFLLGLRVEHLFKNLPCLHAPVISIVAARNDGTCSNTGNVKSDVNTERSAKRT